MYNDIQALSSKIALVSEWIAVVVVLMLVSGVGICGKVPKEKWLTTAVELIFKQSTE